MRKEAHSDGRNIIPCKWVFKINHEVDNTRRWKARLIVKKFYQVAGFDYTESFLPVANSSTITIPLLTMSYIENQGWTCEIFDVKVDFLNTELEI